MLWMDSSIFAIPRRKAISREPSRTMRLIPKLKSFFILFLCVSLLASSVGCYRPAYLDKAQGTEVPERWKVQSIDASRLSPDEKAVFEKMGAPTYIRFFRNLSPTRERVYQWMYTDPMQIVSFMDGKKMEYAVVDDDLSSLNYQEKRWRLWGGISAGVVGALGLLYYYLFARK
jgi:hypothetical protein